MIFIITGIQGKDFMCIRGRLEVKRVYYRDNDRLRSKVYIHEIDYDHVYVVGVNTRRSKRISKCSFRTEWSEFKQNKHRVSMVFGDNKFSMTEESR